MQQIHVSTIQEEKYTKNARLKELPSQKCMQ